MEGGFWTVALAHGAIIPTVNLDTFLFIVVPGLAIAMAVLGGIVSSGRPGHRRAFYAMGAAAFGLSIWQAFRVQFASEQQQEMSRAVVRDLHIIAVRQEPRVPRAKPEGTYITLEKIDVIPPVVGSPLYVSVYFRNAGRRQARGIVGSDVRLLKHTGEPIPPSSQAEDKLYRAFKEKFLKEHRDRDLWLNLDPSKDHLVWGTPRTEQALSQSDLDDINKGKELVFIVACALWEDDAGEHAREFCIFLQPGLSVYHSCAGHNKIIDLPSRQK